MTAAILPFVAFLAAIVLLWNKAVSGRDLVILGAMYFLTAAGVTVGYHRLFTHRAFDAPRPVRYFFAPSAAVRGASQALGGGNASVGPFTSAPGGSGLGTACFTAGSVSR